MKRQEILEKNDTYWQKDSFEDFEGSNKELSEEAVTRPKVSGD